MRAGDRGFGTGQPVAGPSLPKSSISIIDSGSAAQFKFTQGPSARGDVQCSARATISLPTPLSPSTSTVALECETSCTVSNSWRIGRLTDTTGMPKNVCDIPRIGRNGFLLYFRFKTGSRLARGCP